MVIPAKIQTYLKSGIPLIGVLDGDGRKVIDESNAGILAKQVITLHWLRYFKKLINCQKKL